MQSAYSVPQFYHLGFEHKIVLLQISALQFTPPTER